MTGLVAAFRSACVGEPVSAGHLALYALTGVVVFTAGSFFFRRLEMRFADVI
jgi:ABC-type polysaccharide/polyol phosphate export permease